MNKAYLFPIPVLAVVLSIAACSSNGGSSGPALVTVGGSVQGVPVPLPDNVQQVTVSAFAGDGTQAYQDGVGTAASFYYPKGIATDGTNLYVADTQNHAIRKIVIGTGKVELIAGSATTSGYADGTFSSALFNNPGGITTDGKGNLYVADTNNNLIRKIVIATGQVSTIAGDNNALTPGFSDGTGPAARFRLPNGITFDGKDLYVADGDNHMIRKVVIDNGMVTTIAGDSVSASQTPNPFPDGSYADNDNGAKARFSYPSGIASDGKYLYVADTDNHLIRKIELTPPYKVTTVAGDNANIPPIGADPAPLRNGTGTQATFASPDGVTSDGTNLWVADTLHYMIRKIVIATGVVTTVAGDNNAAGYVEGNGAVARFMQPFGITTDGNSLYVTDMEANRVRKIR